MQRACDNLRSTSRSRSIETIDSQQENYMQDTGFEKNCMQDVELEKKCMQDAGYAGGVCGGWRFSNRKWN